MLHGTRTCLHVHSPTALYRCSEWHPAAPSPSSIAVCEMSRYRQHASTPGLLMLHWQLRHSLQEALSTGFSPQPTQWQIFTLLFRRRAVFQHPKYAPHFIDKGANIVSCWGKRGWWGLWAFQRWGASVAAAGVKVCVSFQSLELWDYLHLLKFTLFHPFELWNYPISLPQPSTSDE